jgi:hypothetical protein
MKWSDKGALRRLSVLIAAVPGCLPSTNSASMTGIASYAVDMNVIQTLAVTVLRAVNAPAPDPEFGDDDYRDELRQDAEEALAWAESWSAWRSSRDWSASDRVRFLDPIPTPKP